MRPRPKQVNINFLTSSQFYRMLRILKRSTLQIRRLSNINLVLAIQDYDLLFCVGLCVL